MKFSYTEEIILGLNLGEIVAYSKTKNLEYLKGYSPKSIAHELYDTESLSQPGWKALKSLDKTLYNKKRAQLQKEIFHRKYGYIIDGVSKKKVKARITQELLNGIKACIKAKSDLPYYIEFYNNYFCVYDIDSIIDMAYTLDEKYKEMCKTLIISSIQYHRDKGFRAYYYNKNDSKNKISKNESRKIRRFIIAYIEIRANDKIWNDDDKIIDYLIAKYPKRLRTITMPLEAGWISKSTIKHLTKKNVNIEINPKVEEKRFLCLVKKAKERLLSKLPEDVKESFIVEDITQKNDTSDGIENKGEISLCKHLSLDSTKNGSVGTIVHDKTNIEILESPITDSADEVELNIANKPCIVNNRKKGNENIRVKSDIDYSEQQLISQKIGDRGEEIVLRNEIEKLKTWGFTDDALSKIRRVSLESDDYGYDILSFDKNGRELYLEVKSTKANQSDFSFIITRNELEHAKEFRERYSVVIVFDVLNNPKIWYMGNPFIENPSRVKITPTQFRVDVCTDIK